MFSKTKRMPLLRKIRLLRQSLRKSHRRVTWPCYVTRRHPCALRESKVVQITLVNEGRTSKNAERVRGSRLQWATIAVASIYFQRMKLWKNNGFFKWIAWTPKGRNFGSHAYTSCVQGTLKSRVSRTGRCWVWNLAWHTSHSLNLMQFQHCSGTTKLPGNASKKPMADDRHLQNENARKWSVQI